MGLELVFVFGSKSENRDRAVESVEAVGSGLGLGFGLGSGLGLASCMTLIDMDILSPSLESTVPGCACDTAQDVNV